MYKFTNFFFIKYDNIFNMLMLTLLQPNQDVTVPHKDPFIICLGINIFVLKIYILLMNY